jgi:cell division septal protein FtsQ
MSLFGRRKTKSLFSKPPRRQEIKSRRRVFGRASITQTSNPYVTAKTLRPDHLKPRKKIRRTSASKMALPPNRLTHQKSSKLKKILIILLMLFTLGGMAYFAFFTDYFQIVNFQIYEEGTEITTNLKLNEIANGMLANQNILLFNENSLSSEILKENPEYKTAKITKILPKTIEIELEKFPVTANIIDIIDGADGIKIQKKYLVNSNGMIIMENEENPDLPYIRVSTQQALGINAFPLDQEKLDYIIKLVNLFEEKFGIKVVEAVYLKQAREVHLKTEKGFDVWFDLTKTINSQIDKLKRALPKLDIYKTPLEYIDLRITGTNAEKVLYKRR